MPMMLLMLLVPVPELVQVVQDLKEACRHRAMGELVPVTELVEVVQDVIPVLVPVMPVPVPKLVVLPVPVVVVFPVPLMVVIAVRRRAEAPWLETRLRADSQDHEKARAHAKVQVDLARSGPQVRHQFLSSCVL